jgi:hypothetical protein
LLVASNLRFADDKAHERRLRSTAKWRSIGRGRNEDAGQAASFVIANAREAIRPLDCFVAAAFAMTAQFSA